VVPESFNVPVSLSRVNAESLAADLYQEKHRLLGRVVSSRRFGSYWTVDVEPWRPPRRGLNGIGEV
jgi:hypothetical protein